MPYLATTRSSSDVAPLDQTVERVSNLPVAYHDYSYGADTRRLLIGRLEVDGDEVSKHFAASHRVYLPWWLLEQPFLPAPTPFSHFDRLDHPHSLPEQIDKYLCKDSSYYGIIAIIAPRINNNSQKLRKSLPFTIAPNMSLVISAIILLIFSSNFFLISFQFYSSFSLIQLQFL